MRLFFGALLLRYMSYPCIGVSFILQKCEILKYTTSLLLAQERLVLLSCCIYWKTKYCAGKKSWLSTNHCRLITVKRGVFGIMANFHLMVIYFMNGKVLCSPHLVTLTVKNSVITTITACEVSTIQLKYWSSHLQKIMSHFWKLIFPTSPLMEK